MTRVWTAAAFLLVGCNGLFGVSDLDYEPAASATVSSSAGQGGAGGATTASSTVASSSASSGGAGGAGGSSTGGGAPGEPLCSASDLVACYEFEGDLTDSSGGNHNGFGTNTSFMAGGKPGQALVLGANTSIGVTNSDAFLPSKLSVEAWVWLDSLPGPNERMMLIEHDNTWSIAINDNSIECRVAGNDAASFTTTLQDMTWMHLACTVDDTSIRLYVDGLEVATEMSPVLPMTTNGTFLAIGANLPSGDLLLGRIDSLRVFADIRTPAEICAAADCM